MQLRKRFPVVGVKGVGQDWRNLTPHQRRPSVRARRNITRGAAVMAAERSRKPLNGACWPLRQKLLGSPAFGRRY